MNNPDLEPTRSNETVVALAAALTLGSLAIGGVASAIVHHELNNINYRIDPLHLDPVGLNSSINPRRASGPTMVQIPIDR